MHDDELDRRLFDLVGHHLYEARLALNRTKRRSPAVQHTLNALDSLYALLSHRLMAERAAQDDA